jgi:hypothetical protein
MKYCAAFALMLVVACAGAQKSTAPAPQAMPSVTPSSPKAELDQLYAQIEEERAKMGLPEPMANAQPGAIPMGEHPTTQTDAACHPAESETCTSSCTLSDSICTNADKICKLAKDLEPDADAAAKCEKADKTCKTAHDKCCGCML